MAVPRVGIRMGESLVSAAVVIAIASAVNVAASVIVGRTATTLCRVVVTWRLRRLKKRRTILTDTGTARRHDDKFCSFVVTCEDNEDTQNLVDLWIFLSIGLDLEKYLVR